MSESGNPPPDFAPSSPDQSNVGGFDMNNPDTFSYAKKFERLIELHPRFKEMFAEGEELLIALDVARANSNNVEPERQQRQIENVQEKLQEVRKQFIKLEEGDDTKDLFNGDITDYAGNPETYDEHEVDQAKLLVIIHRFREEFKNKSKGIEEALESSGADLHRYDPNIKGPIEPPPATVIK